MDHLSKLLFSALTRKNFPKQKHSFCRYHIIIYICLITDDEFLRMGIFTNKMLRTIISLIGIFVFLIARTTHASIDTTKIDSLSRIMYDPTTEDQYYLAGLAQQARDLRVTDPEQAIIYYLKFHEESLRLKEYEYGVNALYQIGEIYLDRKMYFNAIEYFKRAGSCTKCRSPRARITQGFAMVGIGNSYFHSFRYREAETYYRKSLELFTADKYDYGIAVSCNNIGLVKLRLAENDSAMQYFLRGLKVRIIINNEGLIGHSHYYLATTNLALGDTTEAIHYLSHAIPRLSIPIDDASLQRDFLNTVADCYVLYGKISFARKKYPEAVAYFEKAISVFQQQYSFARIPATQLLAGSAWLEMGKSDSAMHHFREALYVADSAGMQDDIRSAYREMIRMMISGGNVDSSLFFFNKYIQVTDRLILGMNESKFNEIGLALDIQEQETRAMVKEKNLNVLIILFAVIGSLLLAIIIITLIYSRKQSKLRRLAQQEIVSRKQAEDALAAANLELRELNARKDRFISILSHDLRSPFNTLMGFSDLLVQETTNRDLEELNSFALVVQRTSRNTYQLLENLLAWSRIQIGHMPYHPDRLHLRSELEAVLNLMVTVIDGKSITILNEIDDDACADADSNMLQTILRNLLSNATKFTRRDGTIRISNRKENEYQIILVTDNGIGIPEEKRKMLFMESEAMVTTYGTDNEKGQGFGLLLCRYLAEQNRGRIWLEESSEKGSTFAFSVPVSPED